MNNDNKIEFHFPFKPYSIQIDLMNEIYSSLNNKRVLICESPTGTVIINIYFVLLYIYIK